MHNPILPETGFVRLPTILTIFPVSKSTWWAGVKAKIYPQPVKTVVKWAQQNCSQLEFKAISQNLGHEHAMTTYNAYGDLSVDEQFRVIEKIGTAHADLANVPMDAILLEVARRTSK